MCDNLLSDADVTRQHTVFGKELVNLPCSCCHEEKHVFTRNTLPQDCYDRFKNNLDRRGQRSHPPPSWWLITDAQLSRPAHLSLVPLRGHEPVTAWAIDLFGMGCVTAEMGLRISGDYWLPPLFFVRGTVPVAFGTNFLWKHCIILDLQAGYFPESPSCHHSCAGRRCQFLPFRSSHTFHAFLDPLWKLPAIVTSRVQHSIKARNRPVHIRVRWLLVPDKLETEQKELNELLRRGILMSSYFPWASSVHLVLKSGNHWNGILGCCERLNAITVPEGYPVPVEENSPSATYGASSSNCLDHRLSIGRRNRNIKTSLMVTPQEDPKWVGALAIVLLGLRALSKPDILSLSVELVSRQPVRLSERFSDSNPNTLPASEFTEHLHRTMPKP
ncbi:hypothetical protein TTRE_0000339301 [Trichuris trichiura]|uniref:Uncharacterized protein n=1 Tax=Trichuris trichiura TaxID=36087 RepID=A0A077Z3P4_TRITR|nr:hypothetical protein TTRE_0000339301 [Trichuris trichiura]